MKKLFKILIKIIDTILTFIFGTFIFSKTYDLDRLEKDAKELDK